MGRWRGADVDMIASVRFAHHALGLSVEEALRMASAYPAEAAWLDGRKGALTAGYDADFVGMTDDLGMKSTWIGGVRVHQE